MIECMRLQTGLPNCYYCSMGPLEQGKIKAVRRRWNARCLHKWEIGLASEDMGAKGAPYDVTRPPASFLMGKVTLLLRLP